MKKLAVAALAAVMAMSGVISASAVCGNCPNEECVNSGYCIEECLNECTPQRDGTGIRRGMGKGGCHGGRHCGNNAHCLYR